MAKTVIIAPKGSVSKADKKLLNENDYIVVETDNPDKVKILDGYSEISGTQLTKLFAQAVKDGNDPTTRGAIGRALMSAILDTGKSASTPNPS